VFERMNARSWCFLRPQAVGCTFTSCSSSSSLASSIAWPRENESGEPVMCLAGGEDESHAGGDETEPWPCTAAGGGRSGTSSAMGLDWRSAPFSVNNGGRGCDRLVEESQDMERWRKDKDFFTAGRLGGGGGGGDGGGRGTGGAKTDH
jgi:hypothetical protein